MLMPNILYNVAIGYFAIVVRQLARRKQYCQRADRQIFNSYFNILGQIERIEGE